MRSIIRVACLGLMCVAARASAQKPGAPVPEPPLPQLSAAQTTALDELSSRFAGEVDLHQGWFRDRAVLYYDFGPVPDAVGRVLWPIHGFDAKGNPVAIRGQKPIFSTAPGLDGYSGLWRLGYIVVADKFQPNQIRDLAAAEALVSKHRAVMKEAPGTLNLTIVAKGSRLARDSAPAAMGWYEGREVQFFDFGAAGTTPVPLITFVRGQDASGAPEFLREQNNVVDTLPMAPPYADMWHIMFAHPDSTYVPNSLKSADAIGKSGMKVDAPVAIRNCPIAIVDGARVQRTLSPLTEFADTRSPYPPRMTRPLIIAPKDTTAKKDSAAAKPPER